MNITLQPQTEIQLETLEVSKTFSQTQNQTNTTSPDYTGMKFAILEIADPVSFEEVKKFYGKK